MNKKALVIIGNEKIFKAGNDFYCNHPDTSSLPDGLSDYNQVQYIARSSDEKKGEKLNLKNINSASNIFKFIYFILKTLKSKNFNYLLNSITPYTFFAFLILFLFRKRIFVYLRSSGHEEYKHILGSWSIWIYHIMYLIVTTGSNVIVCQERLFKKKCHLVFPSKINSQWLTNQANVSLSEIKLLYVGRMNPEKGIFEFLKMFENMDSNIKLSIVSKLQNSKINNKNIKIIDLVFEPLSLIKIYDEHNIVILPSFTEGHPQVVDEALARKRPVIIFEDIDHIVKDKIGIFVAKRNISSFLQTTKYIMQNYHKIQENIGNNKLPTRENFLKEMSNILSF